MKLLLLIRFSGIVLHILLGLVLCITTLHRGLKKSSRQKIICWWSRTAGRIFGLRIRTVGSSQKDPVYLVSNHVSWLDIIVLGGNQPVTFLSKEEVRYWPVIGYLARKAGTLFIRRGINSDEAKQNIRKHLFQGNSIAVFPEGTTSNGIQTRPFYPRLFAPIMDGKTVVQPVALIYPPLAAGNPARVNPVVPLKNSANFFASAMAVMQQKYTPVIAHYALPIIASTDQERKAVAAQARQAVLEQIEKAYTKRLAAAGMAVAGVTING